MEVQDQYLLIYYQWDVGDSFNTVYFDSSGNNVAEYSFKEASTLVYSYLKSCLLADYNLVVTSFTEETNARFLAYLINQNSKNSAKLFDKYGVSKSWIECMGLTFIAVWE